MMILSPQELKQLEKEYFIEVPYEDKEFIIMDKKELEKAKKLDLLYIDFLQSQAKGETYTMSADELIKRIENEL
jgi:hypothetical protein